MYVALHPYRVELKRTPRAYHGRLALDDCTFLAAVSKLLVGTLLRLRSDRRTTLPHAQPDVYLTLPRPTIKNSWRRRLNAKSVRDLNALYLVLHVHGNIVFAQKAQLVVLTVGRICGEKDSETSPDVSFAAATKQMPAFSSIRETIVSAKQQRWRR